MADGYVLLGLLGMVAGLVLVACALFGGSGGDPGAGASGRGLLAGWGIGVFIAGGVSAAIGQGLRAFRDIAINSYLALER